MSDPNVHRDLGRHDAEIESLQREMKQLRETIGSLNVELVNINTSITEFKGRYKGGLWVIGGIASIGGIVGAMLSWAYANLPHLPR